MNIYGLKKKRKETTLKIRKYVEDKQRKRKAINYNLIKLMQSKIRRLSNEINYLRIKNQRK